MVTPLWPCEANKRIHLSNLVFLSLTSLSTNLGRLVEGFINSRDSPVWTLYETSTCLFGERASHARCVYNTQIICGEVLNETFVRHIKVAGDFLPDPRYFWCPCILTSLLLFWWLLPAGYCAMTFSSSLTRPVLKITMSTLYYKGYYKATSSRCI